MLDLTTFQILYLIYTIVLLFWFIGGTIGYFYHDEASTESEDCRKFATLSYMWPIVTILGIALAIKAMWWLWFTEQKRA